MEALRVLILGAAGFIGSHLVKRLREVGCYIRAVDIRQPEWEDSLANEFILADLRDPAACNVVFNGQFDEVYQLAADMGGADFIFTGQNDADIVHNNLMINLNCAHFAAKWAAKKLFFSSSACIYPRGNQVDSAHPVTAEYTAYPADPDSDYGMEKLMSERLYQGYARNYRLNIRIARFHNVFGPGSPFEGGREKAPAAICRKVIEAEDGGSIEVYGDGKQTRSFLYIDEAIRCLLDFMWHPPTVEWQSPTVEFQGPVNIGSSEMITINELAEIAIRISGKKLTIKNKRGANIPVGVRGRSSDNKLFREKVGDPPNFPVEAGMNLTYEWIEKVMGEMDFIGERNPDTGQVRRRPAVKPPGRLS